MPTDPVPIDEFRLIFHVPDDLTPDEAAAVTRLLGSKRFRRRLLRLVRRLLRRYPELARATVRLS